MNLSELEQIKESLSQLSAGRPGPRRRLPSGRAPEAQQPCHAQSSQTRRGL